MTRQEHIESLRRHGVRLIAKDGTTRELPADLLETTTKMLNDIRARKITYSIKVPEMSAITKYCRNGSDAVYLAVGGELTIIFFIRLTANPNIRSCLCDLSDRGVSLIVKTTDSLVTAGKIADLFDIDPEKIKVLGSNLHEIFGECTKYTSRGSGGITCNGTFTAFGRAILASKKLVRDVNLSQTVMLAGVFLAAVLGAIFALSLKTMVFSPAVIIAYNLFWMLPVLLVQAFRRY